MLEPPRPEIRIPTFTRAELMPPRAAPRTHEGGFAGVQQRRQHRLGVLRRDDQHKAYAAVEGAAHLVLRHAAGLGQPVEQGGIGHAFQSKCGFKPSAMARGGFSIRPPPVM